MSKYLTFPDVIFKNRQLLLDALKDLGYAEIEKGEFATRRTRSAPSARMVEGHRSPADARTRHASPIARTRGCAAYYRFAVERYRASVPLTPC